MTAASKGPTLSVVPDPKTDTLSGPLVLQPSGWPTPKGYANGMAADGRLVVTGGVIGWDVQQNLAPDFIGQVRQTLSNIADILAEGGARPQHLVRLTWYVVDIEEYLACPERTRPRLPRDFWRALPGDGAGAGGAPGREGGAGRDRSHGGRAALIVQAPHGEEARQRASPDDASHRRANHEAAAGPASFGSAFLSTSLRAERSNPERGIMDRWIASSQSLLAMTGG